MVSVDKIALALLMAFCGIAGAAELSRISVQTLSAGKEVARVMLPIGQQHTVKVEADQVEQDNRGTTHARGNVRVTIRSGGNGGTTTISGDEIIVKRKVLDTRELAAIRALEAMGAPGKHDAARDRKELARLKTIVASHGWPGAYFAGPELSQNAFTVLMRTPEKDLEALLPALREAHAQNDVPGAQLAQAEDRLRVAKGLPQRYGTQTASGKPVVIEDESALDIRRRMMGLPPMPVTSGQ
jgi:ribosomal protein L29